MSSVGSRSDKLMLYLYKKHYAATKIHVYRYMDGGNAKLSDKKNL
jgi:hypothetical protein